MKDSCITEVSNLGSKTVTFYTDEETVRAFIRMNVNAVFGKVWLDGDLGLVQMTRRSMKAEEMVARLGGAIRGSRARQAGRWRTWAARPRFGASGSSPARRWSPDAT